ncbi:MerR family transcriptional regulator [Xenophilus sp. Marseille-Q4582]|uniref:MerR family transcriptional regulator n=1 Tax=Xenophilus sp. Marseille-Q4582 TaxID=2866600 RepID=UPI001CE42F16|nr:MerR family transcriptional regulator [Xenophilus sp. Marseille-Q4582]
MNDALSASRPGAASPPPSWPIEELAARSGLTVRNIRAYGSAGLLPPPALRGRLGLYGADHLQRLEVIRALRAQGFGIEAIRRIFERAPASSWRELVAVAESLSGSLFADETPVAVTPQELAAKWAGQLTPGLLARATRTGLMRTLPDGRVELLSPALGRIGEQLAALGLSAEQAIAMQETLVRALRTMARRWLRTLIDTVLAQPRPDPAQVRSLLANARGLATGAAQAAFPVVLQQELDRLLARRGEVVQ